MSYPNKFNQISGEEELPAECGAVRNSVHARTELFLITISRVVSLGKDANVYRHSSPRRRKETDVGSIAKYLANIDIKLQ
jgi:hypothetical protein